MFFQKIGALWIDHVAVTTARFEETLQDFLSLPNARLMRGPGWNPDQNVHFAFVHMAGDMMVEILGIPEDGNSPISHHVQAGAGAYHLCYAVTNLDDALQKAQDLGAKVIVEAREDTAFDGRKVAFLMHPAHGIFELVDAYDQIARKSQKLANVKSAGPKNSNRDVTSILDEAFADIFPRMKPGTYQDANAGDNGWDSLNHLRLIMKIEELSAENIPSGKLTEFTDYNAIYSYLDEVIE